MPGNLAMLGEAHSNLGRLDEGVACLDKARSMTSQSEGWVGYLGLAYMRAGRRADTERLLAELERERTLKYVSGFAPALCALALGDIERALDWLETAAEDRDARVGFLARESLPGGAASSFALRGNHEACKPAGVHVIVRFGEADG